MIFVQDYYYLLRLKPDKLNLLLYCVSKFLNLSRKKVKGCKCIKHFSNTNVLYFSCFLMKDSYRDLVKDQVQ
jgi:hypothetical protein